MDRESVEDIERGADRVLDEIREKALSGRYRPGNLLAFEKKKSDGGTREITICNLRDRILSRAMAQVLVQRYNGVLVPQCYAYRPHRGAVKAVSAIQKACSKAEYAVRGDFEKFFDRMDHTLLADRLTALGVPEEVLELLMRFVQASRFDGSATYTPRLGVPQGSPLSPVLANLYLNDFDHALLESHPRFVRYADDLVVLTGDVESAQAGFKRMNELAEQSMLSLSMAKTRIMRVEEGFLFLGFVFNRSGHSASREARERLAEKLGEGPRDDELPEEARKRRESVVRGWENYFGSSGAGTRDAREKEEPIPRAVDASPRAVDPVDVSGAEAMQRLVELRRTLASGDIVPGEARYTERLVELAAGYEAAGLVGAARACRLEAGEAEGSEPPPVAEVEVYDQILERWLARLGNSDLPWRKGSVDRLGRVSYKAGNAPLCRKDLEAHLEGRFAVSAPVFRNQNLVWFGVVDLDITRRHLESMGPKERAAKLEALRVDAVGMAQRCREAGVHPLVEFSGYKGYHVWFHATEPMPAADMVAFLQELNRISGEPPEGTHRELFPATATMGTEGVQTHVKWLLGTHPLTGKRGVLLDERGNPLRKGFLPDPATISQPLGSFRQAMAKWTKYRPPGSVPGSDKPPVTVAAPPPCSHVQGAGPLLAGLRQRCGVLDALCRKAETEHDLTHPERVVVRGILFPLGKEKGREAVHAVIRHCDNYDALRTDGFLKEASEKPMACARIREMLGTFCEEAGCNCRFRPLKKEYAHPLRHLRKKGRAASPPSHRESPGKTEGRKSGIPEGRGVPMELLEAYNAARKQALELSKLLVDAIERDGGVCSLGKVVRGEPDAELPRWRVEL